MVRKNLVGLKIVFRVICLLAAFAVMTYLLYRLAAWSRGLVDDSDQFIWGVVVLVLSAIIIILWGVLSPGKFLKKAQGGVGAWGRSIVYLISTYGLLVFVFCCVFMVADVFGGRIVQYSNNPTPVDPTWENYAYFSVVTASTLGYGDMVSEGAAQFFVALEIMCFWLFVVLGSIIVQRGFDSRIDRQVDEIHSVVMRRSGSDLEEWGEGI